MIFHASRYVSINSHTTCVDPPFQTFEGHTNSVLQIGFLNRDTQLASTASDGLLKLWNVRTEECVATMDGHEDKVSVMPVLSAIRRLIYFHQIWALDISSDQSMIATGGADSVVTIWRDCTKEKDLERLADREKTVMK